MPHVPLDKYEDLFLQIAYDTENIAVYAFVNFLINQNESADTHNVAASLLIHPFGYIDGAYGAALHHVRRSIELAPTDVSFKELILFFALTPYELITDEEAVTCAKQILALDPTNKAALDFLQK